MTNLSEIFAMFTALLLFLILGCLPILMMAQSKSGEEDVVYLKDGSILREQVIEKTGEEFIKLEMDGQNVLIIDVEEVEKINRETVNNGAVHYRSSGYINHTGMDLLPGTETTTVRFQMVNGFQLSPKFSLGLGIGFVPYNDPLGLIPVFMEGRYKFKKTNTTPFLFLRTGYNFTVLTDENRELESQTGGLNLNPGVGLEFYSAEFGWYLTAGLNVDKATFEEFWNNRIMETEISFRRLQVGVGLIF